METADATQDTSEDWVTIKDASTQSGVADRTIRSWIRRGTIDALPSERGRMVSLAAVLARRDTSTRLAADAARTQGMADATTAATLSDPAFVDLLADKIAERLIARFGTALPAQASEDPLSLADEVAAALPTETSASEDRLEPWLWVEGVIERYNLSDPTSDELRSLCARAQFQEVSPEASVVGPVVQEGRRSWWKRLLGQS